MAYSAITIANYIINKCTEDQQPISKNNMQRFLYYVQRDSLRQGTPAFDDIIEAWQFGPVVPNVYYIYCGFGAMKIKLRFEETINDTLRAIIDKIVEAKRMLDPWVLVEETHAKGKAWAEIYNDGTGNHCEIPQSLIKLKG